MTNEQLTKLAKEHAKEIATLKEQVAKLIEFSGTVLAFAETLQK